MWEVTLKEETEEEGREGVEGERGEEGKSYVLSTKPLHMAGAHHL